MRTRAADQRDLATGEYFPATTATPLIVEKIPLPVWIEPAKPTQLVVRFHSEGRFGFHALTCAAYFVWTIGRATDGCIRQIFKVVTSWKVILVLEFPAMRVSPMATWDWPLIVQNFEQV
jgi:hypothetical protein